MGRRLIRPVALLLVIGAGVLLPLPAVCGAERKIEVPTASLTRQLVAESVLQDASLSAWISEGYSPHIIYVFFDPNCPRCRELYENTRPWIRQGILQVRWIPVGLLKRSSLGKAAAILDAKDPLSAFRKNEDHYSTRDGGAIPEEEHPSELTLKRLKTNADVLRRTGASSVPTMVFRGANGIPVLIRGLPSGPALARVLRDVQ